jgi:hypothetical protein
MASSIVTNSMSQLQDNRGESSSISSNPYMMFKFSVRSEITRKYYERRIRHFLDFINFNLENKNNIEERCNEFAYKGSSDIKWSVEQVIRFLQFQKDRVEKREITPPTLRNYVKSLKLLCDVCDIVIPWKKITRGLPRCRQASNDRAPTIEEIRKLLDYPDRRIKPIVSTMVSSGIRIGAWDLLQWKLVEPLTEKNGEVTAAKLLVYAGDVEEYYAFITAEAYHSLKGWMDFRASYGEKISGNSWLMRDLWQTTNMNYGARWGLATNPKRLKSGGIKRLLERALWEQGIRQPLKEGTKRHEWKAAHGFRKYYKSRSEQVMRPINVEITMGHDIGISGSYYKPTEKEVLEDYVKAVSLLTINDDKLTLQKQVAKLSEKSKEENYTRDREIAGLNAELASLKEDMRFMRQIIEIIEIGTKSFFYPLS